jgi:hypothetical protein
VASQDAGEGHPSTRPKAETADRLIGIFRAAWQMPATRTDKGGQRIAIKRDQTAPGEARQAGQFEKMGLVCRHSHIQVPMKVQAGMFRQGRMEQLLRLKRGDSDFFTLDPNLASALKNTNAGGISTA